MSSKRKRIIKTTTGIGSEEAEVVSSAPIVAEEKIIHKKTIMPPKKEDKTPIKKGRKKVDEKEPVTAEPIMEEVEVSEEADAPQQMAEVEQAPESPAANKVYPQRRDQQFNIEFDGVILGEGVLEMVDH